MNARGGAARLALLALVLLVPLSLGGTLDPRLASRMSAASWGKAPGGWSPTSSNPVLPIVFRGDITRERLDALGIGVRSRLGSIHTGFGTFESIQRLAAASGIEWVGPAGEVIRSLDVSSASIGMEGVRGRVGEDWIGHTGDGVIVGVIDSGIDISHDDFRRPDGSTRIVYLWDQSDSTGMPPGELEGSYGTEWSGAEIDAGLSTHLDRVGHGTHVAGIAAGDGSAAGNGLPPYRYVGVAPEADLIVVAAELRDDRVLDALAYLQEKAASLNQPMVVNLSLNMILGPRTGFMPLALGVDAFSGPGRIAVASAGNAGEDSTHAECLVPEAGRCELTVQVRYLREPVEPMEAFELECFYGNDDDLRVSLLTPEGQELGPVSYGESVSHTETPSGTIAMFHTDSVDPGRRQVLIEVSNLSLDSGFGEPPQAGEWTLVVENLSEVETEVHAWVGRSHPMRVAWKRGYSARMEIAPPATARNVVAVGSYNTKRCWESLEGPQCTSADDASTRPGNVSWFSSRGPTGDGRTKPDLAAPGFAVMSSFSRTMAFPVRQLWGVPKTLSGDGVHVMQAGTSMSAPHVAGAVALALAQDSELGPVEVLTRLTESARRDSVTGTEWHEALGFGKLDVPKMLQHQPFELPPPPRIQAAPNPFSQEVVVSVWGLDSGEFEAEVEILDITGRSIRSFFGPVNQHGGVTVRWDGMDNHGDRVAGGVYLARVRTGNREGTAKLIYIP